jgi:hypothetical protein
MHDSSLPMAIWPKVTPSFKQTNYSTSLGSNLQMLLLQAASTDGRPDI